MGWNRPIAGSTSRWRHRRSPAECMHDRFPVKDTLTIGLAQLNPTVGDVARNLAKIRLAREAGGGGCDLLVCGELVMIGYPPEDLVLRPSVLAATRRAVEALAADTASGCAVLVTAPWA